MIVKVQISQFTTGPETMVRIYDEDREFDVELPLSTCVGLDAVMGDDQRAFFEAEIIKDKIQLGRRLPEQGW